jgi:hypothetical protein
LLCNDSELQQICNSQWPFQCLLSHHGHSQGRNQNHLHHSDVLVGCTLILLRSQQSILVNSNTIFQAVSKIVNFVEVKQRCGRIAKSIQAPSLSCRQIPYLSRAAASFWSAASLK